MRMHPAVRIAALTIVGLIAGACGGAANVAVDPTAAPGTAAPATTAPAATAAGLSWTVGDTSKATVRVREQLVRVSLPSDAVLTATGAKGAFSLNADGTFSKGSTITFDLRTLASDSRDRDSFIKQSTLRVSQFPTATFVPTTATGLTLPLSANGDFAFTLTGTMTIHGTDKVVTFDVKGTRAGAGLTATATANPSLKFEDFGMSAPSSNFNVVSVVDEIRLVIDLVATGPAS